MLYTRRGDSGTTKLFDSPQGERVSKSESIFEALGALDELNSMTGFAKVLAQKNNLEVTLENKNIKLDTILENVQNLLFTAQARLAGSDKTLKTENVLEVEKLIETLENSMPPITTFLVPGGTELGAFLDILRTVTRRTERSFVKIQEDGKFTDKVSEVDLQFINRLSSLYYALARFVNHSMGKGENPPSYV